MKKTGLWSTGLVLSLIILLAGPGLSWAEKIGFVNLRQVLADSEPGDRAEEDFKKAVEKKKAQLHQKESELKRLKDDLEKQRSVLKADAFREKETHYETKFREYQRLVEDANREMAQKEQELISKMGPEIIKVIQAIGEKEGYTVIMENNPMIIFYRSKGTDITKKVIEEFNKSYRGKK